MTSKGDESIGDNCTDSDAVDLDISPGNEQDEGGERRTCCSCSAAEGPESPSAAVPGVQERRPRRSRRSLAAARRMQSAASIRAMVREKSRRGVLVSLDASTGELELSLSHLAIDEGSGLMGGRVGGAGEHETLLDTNAAASVPTTDGTGTCTGSDSFRHQQSRRGSHMSMASVESWMEEVRRLQEQGQVSDEMLASILADEANAAAAAAAAVASAGPSGAFSSTRNEWNDSSSSLSITDAVVAPCIPENGRPVTETSKLSSKNENSANDRLAYYYRREREMPKMKPLPPLPDPPPIRAPPRDQEQRREARNALARAAIKRVLAEA